MTARKPSTRKKRKSYEFNEYPRGRGKMKCELCGFPLRDHEISTHNVTKLQGGVS